MKNLFENNNTINIRGMSKLKEIIDRKMFGYVINIHHISKIKNACKQIVLIKERQNNELKYKSLIQLKELCVKYLKVNSILENPMMIELQNINLSSRTKSLIMLRNSILLKLKKSIIKKLKIITYAKKFAEIMSNISEKNQIQKSFNQFRINTLNNKLEERKNCLKHSCSCLKFIKVINRHFTLNVETLINNLLFYRW